MILYRGEEIAVPVVNGFHLFADWDAPHTEHDPVERLRFLQ